MLLFGIVLGFSQVKYVMNIATLSIFMFTIGFNGNNQFSKLTPAGAQVGESLGGEGDLYWRLHNP